MTFWSPFLPQGALREVDSHCEMGKEAETRVDLFGPQFRYRVLGGVGGHLKIERRLDTGVTQSVQPQTGLGFVISVQYWFGTVPAELGIIGDNSTNRQRIYRSILSIVGY